VTAPPGITETDIFIDNGRQRGNFGYRANIRDHDNVAPRAGFVYDVGGSGRLVIRGGSGLYYSVPSSNASYGHQFNNQQISGEWRYDGRPYLTKKGDLVDTVARAIKTVTGISTELSTTGGTSDGRFIADICPQVVEFGPTNATIHKVNECIPVADIEQLSRIYQQILVNLLVT